MTTVEPEQTLDVAAPDLEKKTSTMDVTAAEEETFLEKKKKEKAETEARIAQEADEIRKKIRTEREAQLTDSKFVPPQAEVVAYFRQLFQDVDPASVDFVTGLAGISNMKKIKVVFSDPQRNPNHVVHLTTTEGKQFSHIVNKEGQHFFGLSVKQARNGPLAEEMADHFAEMAVAVGIESVKVMGTPQAKELLWLAAKKRGLLVAGFTPSAETRQAFDDFLNGNDSTPATGMTAVAPKSAVPAAGLTAARVDGTTASAAVSATAADAPETKFNTAKPAPANEDGATDGAKAKKRTAPVNPAKADATRVSKIARGGKPAAEDDSGVLRTIGRSIPKSEGLDAGVNRTLGHPLKPR